MIDYTITRLIEDVKRDGSFPTSQVLFEDDDLAAIFSDCMGIRLVPQIMKCREEFFVYSIDYAISALDTTEDGFYVLPLPPRAIGGKIRKLELLSASGSVGCDLPRLSPDMMAEMRFGYFWRGNDMLINGDLSGDTIRLSYFRRPNRIVEANRACTITAIDTLTGNITVDLIPSVFEVGGTMDAISATEPFKSRADDIEILGLSGFVVTVSTTDAAELVVGDTLSLSGESIVAQIPVDLYPILVKYAVTKVLNSMQLTEALGAAMAELKALEDSLFELITTRDEGSPKKIIPPRRWPTRRRW